MTTRGGQKWPGQASLAGLAVGGLAVGGLAVGGCTDPPGPGAAVVPPAVTAAPLVTVPTPAGSGLALSVARRFVFRVRNATCLSTGTAFEWNGTVVTNRHVAAGATSLDLATWAGTDFAASVGGHGDSADLTRLSAAVPGGTVAPPAAPADPSVGTTVYVTGYPLGDQLTATAGTVVGFTSVAGMGVSGPVLELSNAVKPGNSGSPLIDGAGRLVGVVFAIDTSNGDGLAMPLSTLSKFLAGSSDGSSLPCTSS